MTFSRWLKYGLIFAAVFLVFSVLIALSMYTVNASRFILYLALPFILLLKLLPSGLRHLMQVESVLGGFTFFGLVGAGFGFILGALVGIIVDCVSKKK